MLDLNTSLAISINGQSLLLRKGVGGPVLELGKQAKSRKRHNKNFSAAIIEASELAFKTTRCGLSLRATIVGYIYINGPPLPLN